MSASTTKPKTITATLVRGETFILAEQAFKRGKPQAVTPEVRAYLEEHAVDHVTRIGTGDDGENETYHYQKFKFSDGATDEQRQH
jgi:hypothetical protein